MTNPSIMPEDEERRIRALEAYALFDTAPENDFDRLATLASRVFQVPIVLISLLGRDRQFFKARVGLDICETSREVSFCAHAIMQDDILVIPDATRDDRFKANPLVLGPPNIRFYAGKPLIAPGGEKVGTVCLIDSKPRRLFDSADRRNLNDIAALVMDRMEMRRLEGVRQGNQARFENIAATSPDAIICSNTEGAVTFWNRSAERLFGYSADEVSRVSSDWLIPESWKPQFHEALDRLRNGADEVPEPRTLELTARRKDGSQFPAEFSFSTWREGPSISIGSIVRDISERRQHEERLFRQASRDPLTDLENRAAWQDKLDDTLSEAVPGTVMLLDLDGFKEINDTLGHAAGDEILRQVAGRLTALCNDATAVARLGGDEFVVLLPGSDERAARAVAKLLISAISQPYDFHGHRCVIGLSVGVALSPSHGSNAEEILGAADLALYRAKAAGRGRFELFNPELRHAANARRSFERELKLAFENREFELFYQPQIGLVDRHVRGAEALLRWKHPTRGLLTPASFIEVLSQKPSAPAVGEWILRTACRQAVEWRRAIPTFRIGVNLFESQFRSGRLLQSVQEALLDTGLPPDALELELVENILLRTDSSTIHLLNELRQLGVGLAFDDYGTGFASLSLLKRYPVSRIKIDKSFVSNVNVDQEDAAIVRAVLYLGRSFGMQVIAEGVESAAQADFLLQDTFIDDAQRLTLEAQGYFFGKPMPAGEFTRKYGLQLAA